MQTRFTARQLETSRRRGQRADPAQVRALRLLHGDVPDLRAARRRARQPARPHLSDQGHARERPARDGRRRAAHRPLLELPLVHDDVPVGRALPASRSITRACTSSRRIGGRLRERWLRAALAAVLPYPRRVRAALAAAALARPFARLLPAPLRAMLELAPRGRAATKQSAERRSAAGARARSAASASRSSRAACKPSSRRRSMPRRFGCSSAAASTSSASTAAAARSCITSAKSSARTRSAPRSSSGCTPSSTAPGSTRSSPMRRVAARTSRTTATCFATIRELAAQAAAVSRESARRDRGARRARPAAGRRERRAAHRRLPFGVLDAARAESRAAAARAARRGGVRASRRSREGHLCCGSAGTYNVLAARDREAVARAQARAHRAHAAPTSWRRATSAASRSSRPAPAFPSCTPWSCSTGRRAGRGRRRSRT